MIELFKNISFKTSRIITHEYSTSFTLGIQTLDKKFHDPIYGIYGFVRLADEIVDTFHDYDKESLLKRFREDTFLAIEEGISLNPVLNAFQMVVKKYEIDHELIEDFLLSMELDLHNNKYNENLLEKYIYGSAEVVGLMCLKVFTEGDRELFEKLKEPAKKLGSAFQKVNFLRDMKDDYVDRGRIYFPGIRLENFSSETKNNIERSIQEDFREAYYGIQNLPPTARMGVYLAYIYYLNLFKKIKNMPAKNILESRIRVPDLQKLVILCTTYVRFRFNLLA